MSYRFNYQSGQTNANKWMGTRDTAPQMSNPTTNSQDQKKKDAFVNWSKLHSEIIVWNSQVETASGRYAKGDAMTDAISIAVSDHMDALLRELYVGLPTDQTADIWDKPVGLYYICQPTGTVYGVDRSLAAAQAMRGRTIHGAAASLDMIDIANIDMGIQDTGPGIDTLLCSRGIYHTLKAEALTKNGTLLHRDTPEVAKLGLKNEAVIYGNVVITYDPWLKDYSGSNGPDLSTSAFGLTLGDICFQTQEGNWLTPGKFVDLEETGEGGKDAKRSILKSHCRLWTQRPFNHVMFMGTTGSTNNLPSSSSGE